MVTTTYEDGVRKFHNKDDKKGFEIDTDDGSYYSWFYYINKNSYMDFVSMLERAGCNCVVNTLEQQLIFVMTNTEQQLRLADYGLTQPKTILIK